jgi:hypothetical protein
MSHHLQMIGEHAACPAVRGRAASWRLRPCDRELNRVVVAAAVSAAIPKREYTRLECWRLRPRDHALSSRSDHLFASRSLPGSQNRLHQFAFAADNHLRKSFEPPTLQNFWLGDEPVSELTELISRDFALRDSIEQMIQQCRRKILPPNLRRFVADRRSRG